MTDDNNTYNYKVYFDAPSVEEFNKLRNVIGWGDIDSDMAQMSLNNSLFNITIRDNTKLIAMGRIVGDGAMYFYVQDIVVHPEYHKCGLGHKVMQYIESYLSGTTKKGATIGLLCAKGKEGFYERFGYMQRPNDILGNGMCKFI
jgi:GNAT superfamily N-acetyltransferase